MRSLLNREKFSKFHQTLSRSTGSRFSTLSKGRQTLSEQSESKGFTIVELIVIISIIGILAAIGIVSYNGWRQSTNVTQLKSDLNGVSAAMENARTFGDSYPESVPSTFTPSRGVTLFGGSTDGGKTYCVTAVNSQFPTVYYHIDSTGIDQGAQSGSCSLNLVTTAGSGGNATQSGNGTYSLNDTPTITATANSGYIFSSWTGSIGCSGTAIHTITMNASKSCTANFISDAYTLTYTAGTGGSITGTTPQTVNSGASGTAVTASPATYYEFVNWSDSVATASRTDTNVTANKSVTANFTATAISAPATPTVTPITVGATTTYSWGAATCTGNTARYQYRYTINSATPYDSGLIATAATSVDFTTSTEGLTYTVAVQAQCYNTATTSSWSTAGSAGYYRPYTYTLTLTAGTGGSVSQSGTSPYTAGATPTITATPSANYVFGSWSGTNCSGIASHAVPAMSANMACTASFTMITYTLTLTAGTGGTVSGAGTFNSGTSPTMTATPSGIYTFSSWSGSTGCSGSASQTITMNENKACTANFVAGAGWIAGVGSGAMAGKYVRSADAAGTYTWANRDTGCPAGGRSPTLAELLDIYTNRASYGSFQATVYWSSTVHSSTDAYYVNFSDGYTYPFNKTYKFYVRCVSG